MSVGCEVFFFFFWSHLTKPEIRLGQPSPPSYELLPPPLLSHTILGHSSWCTGGPVHSERGMRASEFCLCHLWIEGLHAKSFMARIAKRYSYKQLL